MRNKPVWISLAFGLMLIFLLGCSSGPAQPDVNVQLTGPDHVRIQVGGKSTVVEASRLEAALDRFGVEGRQKARALESAKKQRMAYEAGQDRGLQSAYIAERPGRYEVLMAARAIVSETKESEVMEYVGWTIRNRMRSGRHPNTASAVVQEGGAFSAFSDPSKRRRLMAKDLSTQERHWQRAVRMAGYVLAAPPKEAPSRCITHFVMTDTQREVHGAMPKWSSEYPVVFMSYEGASRAAFYADGSLCGPEGGAPVAGAR